MKITAPKKAGTYTYTAKWNVLRPSTGLPAGTTSTTEQELSTTTVQAQFTLTVNNSAPVIDSFSGATTATEGTTETYSVSASDANDDTLSYNLSVVSGDATVVTTPTNTATTTSPKVTFGAPGEVKLRETVSDGTVSVNQDKTVTVVAANTAPTTPGKPALSNSNTPNQGVFGLTWAASTDDGKPNPPGAVTYTLQHKNANGAFSDVATGISDNSYSFTAASPEAEGTWTYQVKGSDGSLSSAFSLASDAIKVDKSDPYDPTASAGAADYTASNGDKWYKDSATVAFSKSTQTTNGDRNLADGSAGSGVSSFSTTPANLTFSASGSHNFSGRAVDAVGLQSGLVSGSVKVDATAPQSNASAKDADNNNYTGAWTKKNVTVSLSATDAHSGVKEIVYTINNGTPPTTVPGDTATVNVTTEGVKEISFFARDNVGKESQAQSFTVRIDRTPPQFSNVPANQTLEATGPGGATATYTKPGATDNIDGNVDVDCLPASGSTFPLATTTVNCTASDNAGNEATTSFTIEVQDTIGPVFSNVPSDITAEATSASGATVTFTKPTANDAVDGLRNVGCTPASGSTFAIGATEVTCSASDTRGNSSEAKFNVTVEDTTGPVLNLPANITEEATGPNGAKVSFTATANDAVDGPRTVNCQPASGSTFALGTTTVNCSASDSRNNSSQGSFTVKVQDTTAPVISGLPLNNLINAVATSSNGAVVTYNNPTASDLVSGNVNVECTPASGSQFALGSTTVNCSAKDAAQNEAKASFVVRVGYSWSNFLQPINVTGTQSIFKLGSTVPVKFQLTGASSGITDGTFYLKYIRTGAGDGVGEAEAVSTAAATTGNLFRYDATSGQYIFNWGTKGISQAGNYEIRVYTDSEGKNLLGAVSIELKK